jgi:hypothetical protein
MGLALVAGCDVYDSSLLEPTGQGGSGSTSSSSSTSSGPTTSGEGGAPAGCTTASECPGSDSECGTRTCVDGLCGVDAVQVGTPVSQQVSGDCLVQVCDGVGNIVGDIDDTDVPNDNDDCTSDGCEGGVVTHAPVAPGGSCAGGSKVCNADAQCVECIDAADCASMVCTDTFACAPAQCGDNVKNGSETDTDCGGPTCTACAIGDTCGVDGDCLSGDCTGGTCKPSCTDGILNQTESDTDCGGVCSDCAFGQDCNAGNDCSTGFCGGGGTCSCAPQNGVLLLSEIRTRGPGAAGDEFVELFNAGTTPITFSSAWTLESRSETAASYTVRYTGAGQVVPPGGHLLIVGSTYVGSVAGDATLVSGITDEASVVVKNGGVVVDAVCFNCGGSTFSTHVCEGSLATKVGCDSNVDKSVERKPGGLMGNCIDTQNNGSDLAEVSPSNPQNLSSPPTP